MPKPERRKSTAVHTCSKCGSEHRLLVYRRRPVETHLCSVCVGENVR